MPTSILLDLDGLDRAPRAALGRRAWLPLRQILTRLGCPDRAPLRLTDGGLAWADTRRHPLPSALPPAQRRGTACIDIVASAPGVRHELRSYTVDGRIVVLELTEEGGGRELAAWAAYSPHHAGALANERVRSWGGIAPYDFTMTRRASTYSLPVATDLLEAA